MMNADALFEEALADRPDAAALACIDRRSGLVVGSAARSEAAMEEAFALVQASSILCTTPTLQSADDGDLEDADRALIVSERWVQLIERVPGHAELFVVGVADAGANVGLLTACVRRMTTKLRASA